MVTDNGLYGSCLQNGMPHKIASKNTRKQSEKPKVSLGLTLFHPAIDGNAAEYKVNCDIMAQEILQNVALVRRAIEKTQHYYLKGRSIHTALYEEVKTIKQSILHKT